MSGFISGLLLGLSLILAIGAQNAFILKQGLRREHVFILCTLCALSDALLIAFGVYGFAWIATKLPAIEPVARYGGAAFLFLYGARSFHAAFHSNASLEADATSGTPIANAVLACLAFTWLNPHVYLDTFVLLGSVSSQYPGEKLQFALGAISASFLFFYTLGYAARLLAPIFKRPKSWKVLEFLIGTVMWTLAFSLIRIDLLSHG